jgi:hypothetical protein
MLRICAFAPPRRDRSRTRAYLLHYRTSPSISVKRSGIEPELTIAPKNCGAETNSRTAKVQLFSEPAKK